MTPNLTTLAERLKEAAGREAIARIVDPTAWDTYDFRQAQARACVDLGHEDTANLWIEEAHEAVAPSLAKAGAIVSELDFLSLLEALEEAGKALERIAEHPGPQGCEGAFWRADEATEALSKIRSLSND